MINPTKSDINRLVIYRNKEKGRITSFNNSYVFVDYSNTGRGIATSRKDLEWITSDRAEN
jgi:hypothetical protein